MVREEWLQALKEKLSPMIVEAGGVLPSTLRVSCGWPAKGAFSSKSRRVGECWRPEASADKHTEIFISPCIGEAVEVAGVLAHELIHASGAFNHGKTFKRIALAIGLEGPMRATKAGPLLTERLNGLVADLGPYPHAVLDSQKRPGKKEGTRLVKVMCAAPGCGYTIRTTQKWIEVGFPVCPCGTTMDLAE